jgi:hypothetical protein
MVVASATSKEHLFRTLERFLGEGIDYTVFYETDDRMGYTAACTEPMTARQKQRFHNLVLWNYSSQGIKR